MHMRTIKQEEEEEEEEVERYVVESVQIAESPRT